MTKAKQLRGLTVKRSPKGEILLAKGNAIDGSTLQYTLDKGAKGKDATFGAARFFENGKEYLNVTVTIDKQRKAASLRAEGEGVQIEYTVDLSKADSTPKAPVTGTIDGKKIRGTLDLRTQKADVDLRLQPRLPTNVKSRLAYFTPVLEEAELYYKAMEQTAREQPVTQGWWNVIARAGCWVAGGAIAAACCVGGSVVVVGCVVCAGAAGGAASLCNDAVS